MRSQILTFHFQMPTAAQEERGVCVKGLLGVSFLLHVFFDTGPGYVRLGWSQVWDSPLVSASPFLGPHV